MSKLLHRPRSLLTTGACVFMLATSLTAAAQVRFDVLVPSTGLTTLGRLTGANTDGANLTGHTLRLEDWTQVGFTWSETTDMAALPLTVSLPETQSAEDVSADGRVIAGWRHQTDRTAICLVNGVEVTLANAARGSAVMSVDPAGTTVAGATPSNNRSLDMNAATWNTSTGTRSLLGDLSGGALEATALATSADGGTIVGWGTSSSGREAFRHAGSMTPLGDLAGGQFFSEAVSVSSNGAVIVGRSMSTDGMEAFRWTAAEGMVGLGDLPGGALLSEATAVSDDGQIIVGTSDCEAGPEVFVYDATCGMRSLRSILAAAGVDVSGWSFADSNPVLSGNGDVLAGRAIDQNLDVSLFRFSGLRSVLSSLPEPLCSAFARDDAGAWSICFTGEAGLMYQVECSTNLSPPADWQPVGEPVVGCGIEVEIPCAGADDTDARYYRLVAHHSGQSN